MSELQVEDVMILSFVGDHQCRQRHVRWIQRVLPILTIFLAILQHAVHQMQDTEHIDFVIHIRIHGDVARMGIHTHLEHLQFLSERLRLFGILVGEVARFALGGRQPQSFYSFDEH